MVRCLVAVFCGFLASPALANDFMPVLDRSEFLNLIQEKQLRVGLYNLRCMSHPMGKSMGRHWAGASLARGIGKMAIFAAPWIGRGMKLGLIANWSKPGRGKPCGLLLKRARAKARRFACAKPGCVVC